MTLLVGFATHSAAFFAGALAATLLGVWLNKRERQAYGDADYYDHL